MCGLMEQHIIAVMSQLQPLVMHCTGIQRCEVTEQPTNGQETCRRRVYNYFSMTRIISGWYKSPAWPSSQVCFRSYHVFPDKVYIIVIIKPLFDIKSVLDAATCKMFSQSVNWKQIILGLITLFSYIIGFLSLLE